MLNLFSACNKNNTNVVYSPQKVALEQESSMMKRYQEYVKRTAAGDEARKSCERTNEYFKFWDLQTSKQKNWTCPDYYNSRATKQQKNEENSRKEYSLITRRQKLSNLLFEENLSFNRELASMFDWKDTNEKDLKKKYEDLIAKKKEERKVEITQMSSESSEKILAGSNQKMAEEQDSLVLKELRQALELEDQENLKRQRQQQLVNVNLEDALRKLKENENTIATLFSQDAIMSKMEQELFSIHQEKQQKEMNRAPVNEPIRHSRQVVFQLRKKASQVLVELEDDRALLERIQKASEQASLVDDIQKTLYLKVDTLLKTISEQVVKEKRVANHNANIFCEDAMNELKACEQRWLTERTDRKKQLNEVLLKWQKHARDRREQFAREKAQLETECQALIELTKMQREAGKAMADLKASLVQQISMPDAGKSSANI